MSQLMMFGIRIEEPRAAAEWELVPLDFETNALRMLIIKGHPWWVLFDVARILGYRDSEKAKRLLKPHHTTTPLEGCLQLRKDTVLVNASGVYRLILRSDRPEAERFQDWITEEVIPSIQKTGTYTLRVPSRIAQTQRRLGCDPETAKIRCDQIDVNKASHSRLASDKACPNDFKGWHNAAYRGQFDGKEAKELRAELGINSNETPLDHMDIVPLSTNTHSKVIADRVIQEAAKAGRPYSIEEQAILLEQITREMKSHDLIRFGPGATFDVIQDPRRGKIYDVRRPQSSLN